MMETARNRLCLAVILVILISGCGDGDNPSATQTPAPTEPTGPSTPAGTPPATGTPSPTTPISPTQTPVPFTATSPVDVKGNVSTAAVLTAVRVGSHTEEGGFDRIVFEFKDALPDATVEYSGGPILGCASGLPVAVQGQAFMTVRLSPANAHDENGQSTADISQANGTGQEILDVESTCDFEAVVGWAIGLAAQQPFRVTTLTEPSRLVIDIKK